MAKKPIVTSVIEDKLNPTIHPLAKAVDSIDAPIIKSIGFMRVSEASSSWVSYVITTKGTEVLSIVTDEPNLRAIAEESAKISFVNLFTDQE